MACDFWREGLALNDFALSVAKSAAKHQHLTSACRRKDLTGFVTRSRHNERPMESHTIALEHSIAGRTSPGRVHDIEAARRTQLFRSSLGLVEDMRSSGLSVGKPKERFSADFQVCLPYRGLFVWHVGRDEVVGDSNQALFVAGGEGFYLSQPRARDYGELIITPHQELLEEIAGA